MLLHICDSLLSQVITGKSGGEVELQPFTEEDTEAQNVKVIYRYI